MDDDIPDDLISIREAADLSGVRLAPMYYRVKTGRMRG